MEHIEFDLEKDVQTIKDIVNKWERHVAKYVKSICDLHNVYFDAGMGSATFYTIQDYNVFHYYEEDYRHKTPQEKINDIKEDILNEVFTSEEIAESNKALAVLEVFEAISHDVEKLNETVQNINKALGFNAIELETLNIERLLSDTSIEQILPSEVKLEPQTQDNNQKQ